MYRNLEYSHLLFFFLYIVILVRIIGVCLALFNQVTRHISLSLSLALWLDRMEKNREEEREKDCYSRSFYFFRSKQSTLYSSYY